MFKGNVCLKVRGSIMDKTVGFDVENMCKRAKAASFELACESTAKKNAALIRMAVNIENAKDFILAQNGIDIENAVAAGISGAFLDRLTLNDKRIGDMAEGLRQIALLPDPVGEITREWTRPNGLLIKKKRAPIGVVCVIYESRPNVTADVAGLTLKSGNCAVLKGGKEAFNSNVAIADQIVKALKETGISEDAVQIVRDTSRETSAKLLKMNKYIDVIIPRGGESLKKIILEQSSIPVILATAGNCHVYVDKAANLGMAEVIVDNSKTQRPGVCNAMESLLVHVDAADKFLPAIAELLLNKGVELRLCERSRLILESVDTAAIAAHKNLIIDATEEDWGTEYEDMILAVKVVDSLADAIAHINKYGSCHSDAIVTDDSEACEEFLNKVDAAAVYCNASTRFTDGFEFGFGAEIGNSNQKLHARGPIGLEQLTSEKYIVYGSGQIRG